ncbi:hypothetical protein FAUST_5953 [Fusarium austroamericanum]|uniref:Dynein light chain n=1 Tax=Fusarium austroamericanum TaxID=282268 RepID=A0AAN6HER0_FUSAU|nr:hypothetical protein FAUST_5953 [Fusarium austroamericanum]
MADAHAPKAESPVPREKLEAQIKSADMTEDMQQESIEVAQEAMAKFTIEKDIAQHIKRTFDERKGPTWHCIVGRNFGSFVTHGMGAMAHQWGPLEESVVAHENNGVGQEESKAKGIGNGNENVNRTSSSSSSS